MAKQKREKGYRLSLYDKVYRELDATTIGVESLRNVSLLPGEKRYDMYKEIGIAYDEEDRCYIKIHSSIKDRLNFAERVAQHYGANYIFKEFLKKRDANEHYSIWIDVTE